MQISAVQTAPDRFTTNRADAQGPDPIQDRSRQDHVRQVAAAVKTVNQSGQLGKDHELTIALDRDSGHPVMRLIDRQTKEVIRQIPEERVLRMAEEFKREAALLRAALGGTEP